MGACIGKKQKDEKPDEEREKDEEGKEEKEKEDKDLINIGDDDAGVVRPPYRGKKSVSKDKDNEEDGEVKLKAATASTASIGGKKKKSTVPGISSNLRIGSSTKLGGSSSMMINKKGGAGKDKLASSPSSSKLNRTASKQIGEGGGKKPARIHSIMLSLSFKENNKKKEKAKDCSDGKTPRELCGEPKDIENRPAWRPVQNSPFVSGIRWDQGFCKYYTDIIVKDAEYKKYPGVYNDVHCPRCFHNPKKKEKISPKKQDEDKGGEDEE